MQYHLNCIENIDIKKRIKKNKPKCYDGPLALKSKNMDAFIIFFILFRIGPIFFKFILFLHLKK